MLAIMLARMAPTHPANRRDAAGTGRQRQRPAPPEPLQNSFFDSCPSLPLKLWQPI